MQAERGPSNCNDVCIPIRCLDVYIQRVKGLVKKDLSLHENGMGGSPDPFRYLTKFETEKHVNRM